jgi:hypothetical protein
MVNPPSSISVDDSISREISLSWQDVTNAEEYNIYRSESSGTSKNDYVLIDTVSSTTYTDMGLEDGEKYYYRISAVQSQRNIPRSNLQIELDAQNSDSYPGSGNEWFDISGNDYHMSLNSSASSNYTTVDGVQAFDLDGSSFGGRCDGSITGSTEATPSNLGMNSSNEKTVLCVAQVESSGSTRQGMFNLGTSGSAGRHYNLRLNGSYTLWRAQFWSTPDYDFNFDGRNQWNMYVVTYRSDRVGRTYVNNANLLGQDSGSYSLNTSGRAFTMGNYRGSYWTGPIAYYAVYNKGLSNTEIQQAYNALKEDFNLP